MFFFMETSRVCGVLGHNKVFVFFVVEIPIISLWENKRAQPDQALNIF